MRNSQKAPRLYYEDQWVKVIQENKTFIVWEPYETHTNTLCVKNVEFLLMAYGAYSSR